VETDTKEIPFSRLIRQELIVREKLQRHEHKGIAISVMEINEIIGMAST